MNPAQIHLALNHLPIGLVLVGVPLLLIALWKKSPELRSAALVILVLAAVVSIPAFLSGEPAEEIIEHMPGVSGRLIHEHEEAGEFALILSGILGIAALAVLFFQRKRQLPVGVFAGIAALGVVSLFAFLRTAHLGGVVRHPEISQAVPDTGTVIVDHEAREHEDD
ncbi:MAG: hypothetical protein KDD51_08135 [Bdellovibrionales bacterium]|nr:hypothetical protein [Bdellovibrionales bacterium]